MTTNQLNPDFGQPRSSKLSVLGIIFLIIGAPNWYAFFQRRADNASYGGNGGVPRYLFAVLFAMAIAGIVELSVV
ncbi:MAG: hypothetical protein ACFB0G_16255 [Leptolyngbyaceae cyanobacterium]